MKIMVDAMGRDHATMERLKGGVAAAIEYNIN